MELFGYAFLVTGLIFSAISAIGAIRLPDFYTRAHAVGVLDTLGTLLILGGLMFRFGFTLLSAKLFVIVLFIYIANPTVTHVFIRAALKCNVKPWQKGDPVK